MCWMYGRSDENSNLLKKMDDPDEVCKLHRCQVGRAFHYLYHEGWGSRRVLVLRRTGSSSLGWEFDH